MSLGKLLMGKKGKGTQDPDGPQKMQVLISERFNIQTKVITEERDHFLQEREDAKLYCRAGSWERVGLEAV